MISVEESSSNLAPEDENRVGAAPVRDNGSSLPIRSFFLWPTRGDISASLLHDGSSTRGSQRKHTHNTSLSPAHHILRKGEPKTRGECHVSRSSWPCTMAVRRCGTVTKRESWYSSTVSFFRAEVPRLEVVIQTQPPRLCCMKPHGFWSRCLTSGSRN
jgi:hypothetical protein